MMIYREPKRCKDFGKDVTIETQKEVLTNGNGRSKVFETPTCDQSRCPKAGTCEFTQRKSYFK